MHRPVTLYTKAYCPHCAAAKARLAARGVRFTDHDVAGDPARRAEMIARSGGRTTVPQIFVGDVHVGGNDDLAALDAAGRLDALLHDHRAA